MEDLIVKQHQEQMAQKYDPQVSLMLILMTILNSTW